MSIRSFGGGALALVVCAQPIQAQTLESRIGDVENGVVTMTVPSRPGGCGDGRTFMDHRTADGATSFWGSWSERRLELDCVEGPLRVELDVRSGRVRTVDVFVGPDARNRRGTQLGDVDGQEAVDFLLDRIDEPDEDGVQRVMRVAVLADGVRVARRILAIAGDRDQRDMVRERALRSVLEPAEEEGVDGVTELLTRIAGDGSERSNLRERATRVLGEAPGGDAELRALYDELDRRDLRERTIRVVAESRAAANVGWLQDIARDERESKEIRERAIRVLGGDFETTAFLRDLYPELSDVDLRDRVVRVVGEDRSAAADEWLLEIVMDRSERGALRERAIRVLGERGSDEAMMEVYSAVDHRDLKERIVRIVAEGDATAARAWLAGIATDPEEPSDVRERAIRLLGESRGTSTLELAALYDEIDRRPLRERLLRVLGERDDEDAVDKLIAVAESEDERSLRERALRLLAESSHERGRDYGIGRLRGAP